jgi:hypothetical protein
MRRLFSLYFLTVTIGFACLATAQEEDPIEGDPEPFEENLTPIEEEEIMWEEMEESLNSLFDEDPELYKDQELKKVTIDKILTKQKITVQQSNFLFYQLDIPEDYQGDQDLVITVDSKGNTDPDIFVSKT